MYLTLKREATKPPGKNFLQQQAKFDQFINLSGVFAGQSVEVREVAEGIWLISFMDYDLGFFEEQCNRVQCAPNPFNDKVSTMCPAPCVRVVVPSLGLSRSLEPTSQRRAEVARRAVSPQQPPNLERLEVERANQRATMIV